MSRCRLLHKFPHKKLGSCPIYSDGVVKVHPVMGVVYDHQCLVGDTFLFEAIDQVYALAETHIPVVIALDDQYG